MARKRSSSSRRRSSNLKYFYLGGLGLAVLAAYYIKSQTRPAQLTVYTDWDKFNTHMKLAPNDTNVAFVETVPRVIH
jgi:hypothetical protein